MPKVTIGLSEDKKYIRIWVPPVKEMLEKAKGLYGSVFVGPGKVDPEIGPHFRVKAEVDTAPVLREVFGEDLVIEPELAMWYKVSQREANQLRALAAAPDAELFVLPEVLPQLTTFISGAETVTDLLGQPHPYVGGRAPDGSPLGRPYQRADIRFGVQVEHPINANHPGTGKTVEAIAVPYEEEIDLGPKIVFCPKTAVQNVWVPHLEAWTGEPVYGAPPGRAARDAMLNEVVAEAQAGMTFWVVLPWSMLKAKNNGTKPNPVWVSEYPQLEQVVWNFAVYDEYHNAGLLNTAASTRIAAEKMTVVKKMPMSGTPGRGNPMKIYEILHFCYPKEFSAKWRFAEQWLNVEEIEGRKDPETGRVQSWKKVHGIRANREEAFYAMLSRYMVRRTKADVLPWLPPKDHVPTIWVDMTPKQKKQYDTFAELAEVRIEEERLSATSILAEYTRLKQFANAYCTVTGYDKNDRPIVMPTEESPKLEALWEILEERGITEEGESEDQVVVFSQSSRMVDMVAGWLNKKGVPTAKITGDVKESGRKDIISAFQGVGGPRVVVITTMAGGVSITLDLADTVVFLDETWVPDDQEQAEDRIHRGSRIHQVTVYTIHTKGTIEQYIEETNIDKAEINRKMLDLHRSGFRAVRK